MRIKTWENENGHEITEIQYIPHNECLIQKGKDGFFYINDRNGKHTMFLTSDIDLLIKGLEKAKELWG